MIEQKSSILVLGAGSWGTALSLVLARNGHQVWLWDLFAEHVQKLIATRENSQFLPNSHFPDTLQAVEDLAEYAVKADNILVVVPSHGFRETLLKIAPIIPANMPICWATKGLENKTGLLLHEVAEQVFGTDKPLAVLSGPSFAKEVAAELPTAVTIASTDTEYAQTLVQLFHNQKFRPYSSTDIIGVQIGAAVKNIIAIAAGIADGLGFGANARAALITRGLTEMMRLGTKKGGNKETFMGLAGLGDLVLTCTDNQSRNRRFGYALAQGISIEQAQADIGQVVEGIRTTFEINRLATRLNIEMPIAQQVSEVLQANITPKEAVQILLSRQLKAEMS